MTPMHRSAGQTATSDPAGDRAGDRTARTDRAGDRFRDRAEAGQILAERLRPFAASRPIILGLPRGGVPIAAQVAQTLDAPLDIIVVRKLGVPFQPELAMGAIGEDEVRVLNDEVIRLAHVSAADIDRVEAAEREELRRRVTRFRVHHPRRDLRGRTVIIVDDGLATGSTAIAACEVARALGALHIVVAVPVAPRDAAGRLADHADEFISVRTPSEFRAVGQFYEYFGQVTDHEVLDVLDAGVDHEPWTRQPQDQAIIDTEVSIEFDGVALGGHLTIPANPIGIVLFAHGTGSSRHSPRNSQVAEVLHEASVATLLFDLLTADEEVDRANVFDIDLLAGRLLAATGWVHDRPDCRDLSIGYFGASTGAGAALRAAAVSSIPIAAVVSRGGRPDLAGVHLKDVTAPTLLIIGSRDSTVIDLNCDAAELLSGEVRMVLIAGASHLFEEPGTLQAAADEARDWFSRHLRSRNLA